MTSFLSPEKALCSGPGCFPIQVGATSSTLISFTGTYPDESEPLGPLHSPAAPGAQLTSSNAQHCRYSIIACAPG